MSEEHNVLTVFALKAKSHFESIIESRENLLDDGGAEGESIFADDQPYKSDERGIAGDSFHLVGFDDEPGGPKSPEKEFDVGGGEAGEVIGVPDVEDNG